MRSTAAGIGILLAEFLPEDSELGVALQKYATDCLLGCQVRLGDRRAVRLEAHPGFSEARKDFPSREVAGAFRHLGGRFEFMSLHGIQGTNFVGGSARS